MAPRTNAEQIDETEEEDFEGLDVEGDELETDVDEEDEGQADDDQGQVGRKAGEGQEVGGDVLARETRPSRGSARIQALSAAAKEANERAARAERQVQEFLANQRQQQERVDPRAEAERMALMTPEERIEYRFNQSQEQHQRELQNLRATMADNADKTQYAARAASNTVYRKYENEVEQAHQALKLQGQYVSREAILKFKLGERVLQRAETAAPKQRKRAQENIRRQQTKPGQTRQDVQADRRRGGDSPASRLENVQI